MSEYNIDFSKSYVTNYDEPSIVTEVYNRHTMHLFLVSKEGTLINDFPVENIRPYMIPNLIDGIMDIKRGTNPGEYIVNIYPSVPSITEDHLGAEIGVYITDGETTKMKCANINVFSSFLNAHNYDLEHGIFETTLSSLKVSPNKIVADGESESAVTLELFSYHKQDHLSDLDDVYIKTSDKNVKWLDDKPTSNGAGKYTRRLKSPSKHQNSMMFTAGVERSREFPKPATLSFTKSQHEEDFENGIFSNDLLEFKLVPEIPRKDQSATLEVTIKSTDGTILGEDFSVRLTGLVEANGGYMGARGFNGTAHTFEMMNLRLGTYKLYVETNAMKSTKYFEMTVQDSEEYLKDVAEGRFDDEYSMLSIDPSEIVGDDEGESTVLVLLYSKSNPSRILEGVKNVKLVSDTGFEYVTVDEDYTTLVDGTILFKVKAKIDAHGVENISFKTDYATSTKSETLNVNQSDNSKYNDDVENGVFDEEKSTITSTPNTIEGNGHASSLISVTLYSKTFPDKKLVGVKNLKLKFNPTGNKGTLTEHPEKDGVYTWTIVPNIGTEGKTTISFEVEGSPSKSTKTAVLTVTKDPNFEYDEDVKNGSFDDAKSTLSITPSSIDGDGKSVSTLIATLYSKSQPDRVLKGVTTLTFTSSDGTLGTLTGVTETNGVYTGTFKSNNMVFGTTDISFQTNASNKSSKKEKLTVNKSKDLLYDEDVANGTFDDSKTILELRPSTGLVTGSKTDLIVSIFSKSDPTRKLVGVQGLTINGLTIGTAGAMTVDGDNYKFGITNLKHGSNDLSVKTANTTGTKVIKLTVAKNADELLDDDIAGGLFDDAKSGIVSDKSAIEFTTKDTGAEVTVTLYSKSDPSQLLVGVTSVELVSTGTSQGTVTKGKAENGTYKFSIGVPTTEGEQTLKFKTAGGTSTKSVKITYTEKAPPAPEPSDDLFYLTFPERNGALFYAPFPVLFEINRIQDENSGKWKEKSLYENSKYADYIETIAYLIDTYPNTLVLESRNGYHLTNEQLLEGEFYKVR